MLALARPGPGGKELVHMPRYEKRRIEIWERMHFIEGDLFLLSARSGELDPADGRRVERLHAERTQLAVELLLIQYR